jgi:BirA family biotin operon repressor/biotin-[acetyl-CoA-carboxylase] ligase
MQRVHENLEKERLAGLMSESSREMLAGLTVLKETESTNSAVQALPIEQQHAQAIIAHSQTGGRGRRQRHWHSPPGRNIYLSLGWRFSDSVKPLTTLPLAVAVCTCRALTRCGLVGHGIKWPNDILVGDAKLAGILVELKSLPGGAANAVIGIGVNVDMSLVSSEKQLADSVIEQPWTDMQSGMPGDGSRLSRNEVASALLDELLIGLNDYALLGFQPFREEWSGLDLLLGREICVLQEEKTTEGIARGINEAGGLLLEVTRPGGAKQRCEFHAGDVSVKRN